MKNCQKNIIKFGKNSATLSKENLTVNLHTMKNIYQIPYNGKINTNFYNSKIPKECPQSICLSVILIDSGYTKDKKILSSILFWRM